MRKMKLGKVWSYLFSSTACLCLAFAKPELAFATWLICLGLIAIRYELREIKDKSGRIL